MPNLPAPGTYGKEILKSIENTIRERKGLPPVPEPSKVQRPLSSSGKEILEQVKVKIEEIQREKKNG